MDGVLVLVEMAGGCAWGNNKELMNTDEMGRDSTGNISELYQGERKSRVINHGHFSAQHLVVVPPVSCGQIGCCFDRAISSMMMRCDIHMF